MSELVEQAEVHLIMSKFAAAERSSKEALDKLKGVSTPDLELQSRACSIHLQALFEQGRCVYHDLLLISLDPFQLPFEGSKDMQLRLETYFAGSVKGKKRCRACLAHP